jgi:hypothetical protein
MKVARIVTRKPVELTLMWIDGVLLFIIATLSFWPVSTNGQVPDTALKRVLEIKVGEHAGTAFTVEVDGRQYVVTAKHLVAKLKPQDTIDVRMDEGWGKLDVKVYLCDDPVDVAVLIADYLITATSVQTELTLEGAKFGQEFYFLGFPYDSFYSAGGVGNEHHPLPFIKRATFSGVASDGVFYLDGYNNPGFSGGPIVYRDLDRSDYTFKVGGVVVAFFPDLLPVLNPVEVKPGEDLKDIEPWRIRKMEDGKKYKFEDTKQKVATNTGIVKGYNISTALELIKKHPDGPKVVQPQPKP